MKNRSLFLLLLAVSPGIWWIALQPGKIVSEISNIPSNISTKVLSYTSEERVLGVQDMRWAHVDTEGTVSIISKVYYNKLLVIPDEIVDFLTFLSPKFYFQAGDGSGFSPPGVDPIAAILFPFFVLGIVEALYKKNWKIFLIVIMSAFLAYISGRKSLVLLFPVMMAYLYLAALGINSKLNKKAKIIYLVVVVIYSVYMIFRALWITF